MNLTGLRQHTRCAALLIALAVLPYLQTLSHDFINYDDNLYVTENHHVQQGLTLPAISWAFTTFKGGNWHPLTWLSHMLDINIWDGWPGGHHLTNVALHAANTLLLFLILLEMTGGLWRSALVGALFAVHPLHVESVAWIAERKDVLSTFFGLLALWAYLAYTRRPSAKQYLAMTGFFILSLMAKPMLVTFPFLLLLLDVWPLKRWRLGPVDSEGRRSHLANGRDGSPVDPHRVSHDAAIKRAILEKLPLFVVAAMFSVIAIVSQRGTGALGGLVAFPLSTRIVNAFVGYALYLEKLVAPVNLAVFYPHPGHWPMLQVAVSVAILLGITVVAIWQRGRRPWLLIGWLWFVGMLVPVIGLIQIGMQSIADRYTYFPAIGAFIMIAWSIPAAMPPMAKRAVIGAACICILGLTIMTWRQISYWQNSRTLFTHALAVTRGNFIAHQNLGSVFEGDGNLNAALEQYRWAASEFPGYGRIHENIGNVLLKQGRYPEALAEFKSAIDLDPHSSSAFNSIGSIALMNQQYDDAAKYFRRAVELDPDNVPAHINFGTSLVKLGRYDQAIAQLAPITRAEPKRIVARTNLARALAGRGNVDQAIAELHQILQMQPEYAPAREALQEIQINRR